MIVYDDILNEITNSIRQIKAKVEVYNASTNALIDTFYDTDRIKSYSIERVGDESKFFGYGVKQKLNLKLLDPSRELDYPTRTRLEIFFNIDGGMNYYSLFPYFYITEIHRDENTGELSITAYDMLNEAAAITADDLYLTAPYTIEEVAAKSAEALGLELKPLTEVTEVTQYVELINYDMGEASSVSFTIGKESDYIFTEGWGNITVYLTDEIEGTASFTVSEYGYTNVPEVLEREYGEGILSIFWKVGNQVEVVTDGSFSYVAGDITSRTEVTNEAFSVNYEYGVNIEGTETVEELLTAIAEATQTIYFINHNKQLQFKELDRDGPPAITITKEDYITLDSKTNRRLTAISSVTELGDNLTAQLEESGTHQYIRDNPFLNTAEGVSKSTESILTDALGKVGGLTINQFNCDWRGNPLVEIGDKIGLVTKDNKTMFSFIVNDVVNYDGGFKQKTQWNYPNISEETASNPVTLGEVLKETYARVDKANKTIQLLTSETRNNTEAISSLALDTKEITATVKEIKTETNTALEGVTESLTTLSNRVEAKMSSDDVTFLISQELSNGIEKVDTTTGITLDSKGLTVDKTDSTISTTISEDGMAVKDNSTVVLTANSDGVKAKDLNATTYLIVGKNSRFEDYGSSRTGCFWIGR